MAHFWLFRKKGKYELLSMWVFEKDSPSSDWNVGRFQAYRILDRPDEGDNLQNKEAESCMLIKTSNVKQYMNLEDGPSDDILIQIII